MIFGRRAVPVAARTVLGDPVHFTAFGLGVGLSPWAPGTLGTLLGLPLVWLVEPLPLAARAGIAALLVICGSWICHMSARRLGVHDHPGIVLDEVTGFYVAMLLVPLDWVWGTAGFVLFRLFDIFKPWPVRWADRRLPGGVGIMADDVLAGLYAMLLLWGVRHYAV
ncbi:MAG TPA: phosphatidylglycerophosphatase A [Gammaproteobacteria bacterium]|nr:phosphatidylglycerophosphatase A [Gammaproteobacteria bacterium]